MPEEHQQDRETRAERDRANGLERPAPAAATGASGVAPDCCLGKRRDVLGQEVMLALLACSYWNCVVTNCLRSISWRICLFSNISFA